MADASPLQYLLRIEAIHVLLPLYQRVLVSQSVPVNCRTRTHQAAVRDWIAQPPAWCEVRPDLPADATLAFLDPGERAAIALAMALHADGLLIDEYDGRREAEHGAQSCSGDLELCTNLRFW